MSESSNDKNSNVVEKLLDGSELSTKISSKAIENLRSYMSKTLDSVDDNGNISLDKIMNNTTQNMGNAAAELCGLIFQEKAKLETMEDLYRKKRKEIYELTMNTRYAWSPTQKGVEIMVDGDQTLSTIKRKVEIQRLYVELLGQYQECIRYYPRNAQTLINIASYGKEIGQIL